MDKVNYYAAVAVRIKIETGLTCGSAYIRYIWAYNPFPSGLAASAKIPTVP
jgi:hypothetical protein